MKNLYWIAGIAGAILTPVTIVTTYFQRGYFAIGGEILIAPLLLMIVAFIDMAIHGGSFSWEEEIKQDDWMDNDY